MIVQPALLVLLNFWVRFQRALAHIGDLNYPVTALTQCFSLVRFQCTHWPEPSHFVFYKHWPFRPIWLHHTAKFFVHETTHTRPIRNCRGGTGYCNTLGLEGTVPKVRQITAVNYTSNHQTNISFTRCFRQKIVSFWAFKVACAQDNVKFHLYKKLSIRFKDYWELFRFHRVQRFNRRGFWC